MKYNITPTNRSLTRTLLVAVSILTASIAGAQSAEVLHNPSQVEITEGETFEVMVEVHSGEQLISVADVYMHFDPQYLEVLEVSVPEGGMEAISIAPAFNNSAGTIEMGSFQMSGQMPSGVTEVLQITFRGIASTPITSVEHPSGAFPRSILAYAGVNHLGTIGPLDITILPSVVLSDGDEELENDDLSLEIWPNPTQGHVTINFQESLEQIQITIKNLLGQTVYAAQHINEDQIDLEIVGANGLYFIEIESEVQQRTVCKILKSR